MSTSTSDSARKQQSLVKNFNQLYIHQDKSEFTNGISKDIFGINQSAKSSAGDSVANSPNPAMRSSKPPISPHPSSNSSISSQALNSEDSDNNNLNASNSSQPSSYNSSYGSGNLQKPLNSSTSSISAPCNTSTGVVTTQNISTVIKPRSNNNSLQFVKIQTPELSKKAVEQIKLSGEKEKIKEVEEEWQSNLLNWKSKRRQQLFTNVDYNPRGSFESLETSTPRKTKTFNEILKERSESGNRLGFNLMRYMKNDEEEDDSKNFNFSNNNSKEEEDDQQNSDRCERNCDLVNNNINNNNSKCVSEEKQPQDDDNENLSTNSPNNYTQSSDERHKLVQNNPSSVKINGLNQRTTFDSRCDNQVQRSNLKNLNENLIYNSHVRNSNNDNNDNNTSIKLEKQAYNNKNNSINEMENFRKKLSTSSDILNQKRNSYCDQVDSKKEVLSRSRSICRSDESGTEDEEDDDENSSEHEEQKQLQRIAFEEKLKAFEKLTKPSLKLTRPQKIIERKPLASTELTKTNNGKQNFKQNEPIVKAREEASMVKLSEHSSNDCELEKSIKNFVKQETKSVAINNISTMSIGNTQDCQKETNDTTIEQKSASVRDISITLEKTSQQSSDNNHSNNDKQLHEHHIAGVPSHQNIKQECLYKSHHSISSLESIPQPTERSLNSNRAPRDSTYNANENSKIQPLARPPPSKNSNTKPADNDQSLLSVSGRKRCSTCREELGRGAAAFVVESLNLFYHTNCFRCSVCHLNLSNGFRGVNVRVQGGALHCQNCYSKDGLNYSKV